MTFDSQHFLKNISPFGIRFVTIVDGSHTCVDGYGDIDL